MKIKNLLAVGFLVLGVSLSSCAKKQGIEGDEGIGSGTGVSQSDIDSGMSDSDSGNAMGLQTVHFPFDSFEIVGENRAILRDNVAIMKENPGVNVQIEGHADERGGIQYNLALGEKRANAVKQQMVSEGVSGSRITIISMGKEKPLDPSSNEEAWAKNRRANFVITSK